MALLAGTPAGGICPTQKRRPKSETVSTSCKSVSEGVMTHQSLIQSRLGLDDSARGGRCLQVVPQRQVGGCQERLVDKRALRRAQRKTVCVKGSTEECRLDRARGRLARSSPCSSTTKRSWSATSKAARRRAAGEVPGLLRLSCCARLVVRAVEVLGRTRGPRAGAVGEATAASCLTPRERDGGWRGER